MTLSCLVLVIGGCGSGADDYKSGDNNFIRYDFERDQVYLHQELEGLDERQLTGDNIVAERIGRSDDGRTVFFGITEVSRAQWRALMDSEPWDDLQMANFTAAESGRSGVLPAHGITLAEAEEYVQRLARASGLDVRLADAQLLDSAGIRLGDDFAIRERSVWFEPTYAPVLVDEEGVPDEAAARVQYGRHIRHLYGNVREWTKDGWLRGGGFADNRLVVRRFERQRFPVDRRHFLAGLRIMILM
ncbi:MAG: hypothetical protein ACOCXA_03750 [Planctomycetota bacterium]